MSVEDRSIFDLPLDQWTYAMVDDFLNERVGENDRLEYKEQLNERVTETLVSFANGQGGHVFVGVSEVSQRKTPLKWPLLEPNKDHAVSAYNRAAQETIPPAPLRARSFAPVDGEKQVLVIEVAPGDLPPYFAKNQGVKIRVGDNDVAADPASLEALFTRRQSIAAIRAEHSERASSPEYLQVRVDPLAVRLQVFVEPMSEKLAFRFNESTTSVLEQLVELHLRDFDHEGQRDQLWLDFSDPAQTAMLRVTRDGMIWFSEGFADLAEFHPDQPQRSIPTLDWFSRICSVLEVCRAAYSRLTACRSGLYVAIVGRNIYGRPLNWPPHLEAARITRGKLPLGFGLWIYDERGLNLDDDPRPLARDAVKSLFWATGYREYENFVDLWAANQG